MSPSLLHPPSHLSPQQALELSQRTPSIFANNPRTVSSSPLSAALSASESSELWTTYENLLLSCLRTGDEPGAHECLERLVQRFGAENEKVMALKGMTEEAEANGEAELGAVLRSYQEILEKNPTNVPITKRRIALLRSLGRTADAILALTALLEFLPVDAEAWAELAEIYLDQGVYSQAIYCLEEVLILTPNAWNMHAQLGEVQYMQATLSSAEENANRKNLAEALKRFSRSIELCDDYLRGYYGLKLVTSRLLSSSAKTSKGTENDDFALPDQTTIEELDQLATEKLSEIIRRGAAHEKHWTGYEESELAAARDLLSKESHAIVR